MINQHTGDDDHANNRKESEHDEVEGADEDDDPNNPREIKDNHSVFE